VQGDLHGIRGHLELASDLPRAQVRAVAKGDELAVALAEARDRRP
jgi:hypothetical protein